jgi:hypothetical protein
VWGVGGGRVSSFLCFLCGFCGGGDGGEWLILGVGGGGDSDGGEFGVGDGSGVMGEGEELLVVGAVGGGADFCEWWVVILPLTWETAFPLCGGESSILSARLLYLFAVVGGGVGGLSFFFFFFSNFFLGGGLEESSSISSAAGGDVLLEARLGGEGLEEGLFISFLYIREGLE